MIYAEIVLMVRQLALTERKTILLIVGKIKIPIKSLLLICRIHKPTVNKILNLKICKKSISMHLTDNQPVKQLI
jgi:hypothetical protein